MVVDVLELVLDEVVEVVVVVEVEELELVDDDVVEELELVDDDVVEVVDCVVVVPKKAGPTSSRFSISINIVSDSMACPRH